MYSIYKLDSCLPISVGQTDENGNPLPENPIQVDFGENKMEGLQWLPSLSLLIVDHSMVHADPEQEMDRVDILSQYVDNGITIACKTYKPLCMGSSNVKDASSIWCDVKYIDRVLNWWHCGYKLDDVDLFTRIEKDARMITSSKSFESVFGTRGAHPCEYVKLIDIRRTVVSKDIDSVVNTYDGKPHLMIGDLDSGNRAELTKEPWTETVTDGAIYYIIDDRNMSEEEHEALMKDIKAGKLPAYTTNAPGFKGCINVVLMSAIIKLIEDEDGQYTFIDSFGTERDIRNVQTLTFNSSFKWIKSKEIKDAGWPAFQNSFSEYGHTFDVCVVSHPRMRPMPYQMTAGLMLDHDGQREAVQRNKKHLDEYKYLSKAVHLLPKYHGLCALAYRAMAKGDEYTRNMLQAGYTGQRWAIGAAKLPNAGKYFLIGPDPIYVFRNLLNCSNKNGFIKPGYYIHRGCKPGKENTLARNPFPGQNFEIRIVQEIPEEYDGFFCTDMIFVSAKDDSMATAQADFDGDKMLEVEEDWFVQKAKEGIERTGYKLVKWPSAGHKPAYSQEAFYDFIVNCTPAEIGLYALAGLKVKVKYSGDEQLIKGAWEEKGTTMAIDKSKGTGEIDPETDQICQELALMKKPLHIAYQKSGSGNIDMWQAVASKCKYYPDWSLDRISQLSLAFTSATLNIKGVEEFEDFRWKMLTGEPASMIPGLGDKLQEWTEEYGKKYKELVALGKTTTSFTEQFMADMKQEIMRIGGEAKYTESQTITAFIKYCYNGYTNRSDEIHAVIQRERNFRIMWTLFGEEIYHNIINNLKLPPEEIEEIEEAANKEEFLEIEPPDEDGDGTFGIS